MTKIQRLLENSIFSVLSFSDGIGSFGTDFFIKFYKKEKILRFSVCQNGKTGNEVLVNPKYNLVNKLKVEVDPDIQGQLNGLFVTRNICETLSDPEFNALGVSLVDERTIRVSSKYYNASFIVSRDGTYIELVESKNRPGTRNRIIKENEVRSELLKLPHLARSTTRWPDAGKNFGEFEKMIAEIKRTQLKIQHILPLTVEKYGIDIKRRFGSITMENCSFVVGGYELCDFEYLEMFDYSSETYFDPNDSNVKRSRPNDFFFLLKIEKELRDELVCPLVFSLLPLPIAEEVCEYL